MEESAVWLRMLGPVQVARGSAAVASLPPKPRLLLAALALAGNTVVSFSHLFDVLWEGSPPASARANLRAYTATVRAALDDDVRDRLSRREYGYQLALRPGDLDVDVFSAHVAHAESALGDGDHQLAADLLERALSLWRGRAGEGLPPTRALAGQLDALTEQRLVAHEMLAEARLALGGHRGQIAVLERIVAVHPLRERSWAALMRARYACGDVDGALRAYRQCREALSSQLGIEPGDELVRLQRMMLNRARSLPTARSVPEATPAAAAETQPTRERPCGPALVGRAGELSRLRDLLHTAAADPTAPVVVVHGPVGVGTSSLAARALADSRAWFPDGVCRLDLDVDGPGEAPPWRPGTREVLLVEHATTAAEVRPLAAPPPGCVVLVTSGGPLGALDGARRLSVSPLGTADGLELLGAVLGPDRVRGQRAAARDLVEYCDGLPLALRACAARLLERPLEPIGALAERLSDPRFRLPQLTSDDLDIRGRFRRRYLSLCQKDPLAGELLPLLAGATRGTVDGRRLASQLRLAPAALDATLDRFTAHGLLTVTEHPYRYRVGELSRLAAVELTGAAHGVWRRSEATGVHPANRFYSRAPSAVSIA